MRRRYSRLPQASALRKPRCSLTAINATPLLSLTPWSHASLTACLSRLNDEASVRLDLMADLARQVITLRTRLTLRDIRSARERVLAFLAVEAGDDGCSVLIKSPLRDLAHAIGLTPEAFYRTLALLERDGAITRRSDCIVLT